MTDRLDAVMVELREFVGERDWEQFHDPKNLAMLLSSEAGELLSQYRWIRNDEADSWSSTPDHHARVTAEAADVGIALLMFCDRLKIDLIEAIKDKIEVNRANYPAESTSGVPGRPDPDHRR